MKKTILIFFMIFAACANAAIVFVVNSGSETLSRIDTETGQVDNAFASLGSMPNRLVVTDEFIYVVNSGDNNVQKISISTGATIEEIFLESSANPYDLCEYDGFLYVSGSITNQLYKIDLETDSLVDQISVGSNPAGMAVLDGYLYVGNTDYLGGYNNGSVMKINTESFNVENTIPTHANPQYLLAANDYIHVSCTGNWNNIIGAVQVIDPATNSIIETIDIGGNCGDLTHTDNGTIYIGDAMNSGVYAYDEGTFEVIYNSSSAFTPGGSVVEAYNGELAVMGGEWGQNFTVHLFDILENPVNNFTVGLYATDMKFMEESTAVNNDEIQHIVSVSCGPNPFTDQIRFSLESSRSNILSVMIYDLKGRKIKEINHTSSIWDGKNEKGVRTASGIYFAKIITSENQVLNAKILKLKE